MIVLDMHIWSWWVHGDDRLTQTRSEVIKANESGVIGVCTISCWEMAKLVEYGRLELPCPLVTSDSKLRRYPHVETIA